MDGRVVVWFSCGAASAVAAKMAVDSGAANVHVVYCDTLAEEHPDNLRFLRDVEKWIGQEVEIIASKKYKTIVESWYKGPTHVPGRGYMAGIAGAQCTLEMKKIPRLDYQQPNDLHIFGLTVDEGKRIAQFEKNNPDLDMEWNLRNAAIDKEDCYRILEKAGIALPVMYSLGFKNNNCIGCVKATSIAYWQRVRKHFPEVFQQRAQQSRAIGCRLTRLKGVRIFLDEIPLDATDDTPEEDIECGVICVKP